VEFVEVLDVVVVGGGGAGVEAVVVGGGAVVVAGVVAVEWLDCTGQAAVVTERVPGAETFPAASEAATASEYVVAQVRPETPYVRLDVSACAFPFA
jgi:hypothetical protein